MHPECGCRSDRSAAHGACLTSGVALRWAANRLRPQSFASPRGCRGLRRRRSVRTVPMTLPLSRPSAGTSPLRCRTRDHGMVVTVAGEVDLTTVPELHEELLAAETRAEPGSPVILDLRGVTFLGSAGLAVLVQHHRRCADAGRQLRIVADQHVVRRPLAVTDLDRLLFLTSNLDDAMPA
ncbi:anti-sigma factor antagonist [Pseudonocardiaceae bacterium YIM PH 21723]|nr:anti-sigma factor antagonist [Pseudonocardiaceae bacterium YIM PH 21723]